MAADRKKLQDVESRLTPAASSPLHYGQNFKKAP
jgi:hypothetical protein